MEAAVVDDVRVEFDDTELEEDDCASENAARDDDAAGACECKCRCTWTKEEVADVGGSADEGDGDGAESGCVECIVGAA